MDVLFTPLKGVSETPTEGLDCNSTYNTPGCSWKNQFLTVQECLQIKKNLQNLHAELIPGPPQ